MICFSFLSKGADPALKTLSVLYSPQNWCDHLEGDWHNPHWGSKYLWSRGWRKGSRSRERTALLTVWSSIKTQWSTEKNERMSGDAKGKQNTEGLRILHLYTKTAHSLHFKIQVSPQSPPFLCCVLLVFIFFLLPCRFQKTNGQRHLLLTCNSCRVSHSVAFLLDRTCLVNEGRCTLKHSSEYWGSSTNGFQATIPWAHESHRTLELQIGLKLSTSCQLNKVFSLENAGEFYFLKMVLF